MDASRAVPEHDSNVYQYSRTYRILFLIGAAFFFGCTLLAIRSSPERGGGLAWPAITLFCFGVLDVALLWAMLPTFITDTQGITRVLLGRKRYLPWRDIQSVEHRPVSNSLLLKGASGRLRIHRQIRGFIELFEAIRRSAPAGATERPFTIPFSVAASWNLRVVFGGMLVFFLSFGLYALLERAEPKSAAMLLGLAALNGVFLGWHAFLRFEFDGAEFRIVYPLRTVRYQIRELGGAALVQRDLDIALVLQFGPRTIELSDNQIVAAPERVYESLVRAYGLDESANIEAEDTPR